MATTTAIMLSGSEGGDPIVSLFWIALAAVAAPLLAAATRRFVPDVVLLLVLGCLIGPHVLGWASTEGGVSLVREIGLGMLFLLAGYEIDTEALRGRSGKHAWLTWFLCVAVAMAMAWVLVPGHDWMVMLVLALCLTSTALGTLLPILKSTGQVDTPLGSAVLTHGAVGELGPVIAMALLLSTRTAWLSAGVLAIFAVLAVVVAVLPRRTIGRIPGVRQVLYDGASGTTQTALRVVFLLLLTLMALASVFDLDVVLGAFAAGIILRRLTPAEDHAIEERLESVAFSFFIPVFFVTSGMGIDVAAVGAEPLLLVSFVVMILLARGVPVWLRERFTDTGSGLTTKGDQVRLGLYAATGLPIIVAVTEVAVARDLMPEDIASLLVAAGAVTVLLFPLTVRLLPARAR
ncbi:cation:proton antiporter [Janibacter sp. GXQ6167]|uniref:cation:proton antiporter n=1 Tax=Janibacter sp. GXQ6167 TaxID=3240791 RepID=UPI003524A34D